MPRARYTGKRKIGTYSKSIRKSRRVCCVFRCMQTVSKECKNHRCAICCYDTCNVQLKCIKD